MPRIHLISFQYFPSFFLPFTLSKANTQVILEDEKSHLFSLYLGLESFLKCIAPIFHLTAQSTC